jgi:Transposase IS116/IS110/IS902 family
VAADQPAGPGATVGAAAGHGRQDLGQPGGGLGRLAWGAVSAHLHEPASSSATGWVWRNLAALLRPQPAAAARITLLGREISTALAGDVGYLAIQAIPGVGPVLAAVFVAEIGDIHRFAGAPQLCSWAGLTPRHRESDTTVRRGPITKQGPRLVRWAAVEATQRLPGASKQAADFHRIADRRGTGIGRVAAARRLLTLVFYGLRDGQVRCLAPREAM